MNPYTTQTPIDPNRLAELRALFGGDDELNALFRDFFRDLPSRMVTLRAGLQKNSSELVDYAAHTLKGSAASLGAKQAAELAADIERLSRLGKLAQASALYAELESELKRLWQWLGLRGLT